MPDAVLIVTFSPVQPFIAEARRTTDLYAGSRILVKLARAAAGAVQDAGATLVYPADLSDDMPNKLVAIVPWDRSRTIAERAERALREEWAAIAASARQRLAGLQPAPDAVWEEIWQRQAPGPWEVYWAAAVQRGENGLAYAAAYRAAERALAAAKRTRAFTQTEEPGMKDTLSGRRTALRTAQLDARAYWAAVARNPAVTAATLRPEGRERLDTLGVVKRFAQFEQTPLIRSTSSVASADFLARARTLATDALHAYRTAVDTLLGEHAYRVHPDVDWPYDGDLFYQETLTPNSLADRYTLLNPDGAALERVRDRLRGLHKAAAGPPSPYYGIVVLDGDDMGKRIDEALQTEDPLAAHTTLSGSLTRFAREVPDIVEAHHGQVIYNGGDDVLLLAPLRTALQAATKLANRFEQETGGTASAGIAIAHHLYPLDVALTAARAAEQLAKEVDGKAAVCVRVLKRSGETADMRSRWQDLDTTFAALVALFTEGDAGQPLASRFPYDVVAAAHALPDADERFHAELCRLFTRHRNGQHPAAPDPAQWAQRLTDWARRLPHPATGSVTDELARWLVLARFVAQGGSE